jgi:hypothetical protein
LKETRKPAEHRFRWSSIVYALRSHLAASSATWKSTGQRTAEPLIIGTSLSLPSATTAAARADRAAETPLPASVTKRVGTYNHQLGGADWAFTRNHPELCQSRVQPLELRHPCRASRTRGIRAPSSATGRDRLRGWHGIVRPGRTGRTGIIRAFMLLTRQRDYPEPRSAARHGSHRDSPRTLKGVRDGRSPPGN